MKKHIFALLFISFIGCAIPEEKPNYNAAYFLAEWQRQYLSWGYDKDSCCYTSIDSTSFEEKTLPVNLYKGGYSCSRPKSQYSYCGFTDGVILDYNQKKYMWGSSEFFEPLFWRVKPDMPPYSPPICRTRSSAQIDTNKHFFVLRTWSEYIEMWKVYLMPQDAGKPFSFNNQYFAESKDTNGYIFDISHYGQFEQINQLIRDNPKYHSKNNLHEIDSLLFRLQDYPVINSQDTIPYTHIRLDVNAKTLFPANKVMADSIILQKSGIDFLKSHVVYFNGVETALRNKSEYKDEYEYRGYRQKIDSLKILHSYLNTQKPTFLYYKAVGNNNSLWYNYFIAFHIDYDKYGIPNIAKVDLICPQRVYYYLCYPNNICDDVNPNSLFKRIEFNNYREIHKNIAKGVARERW